MTISGRPSSEMFGLMYAAKGVGLAANQVALPYRFFILNITADPEQKDQELVFINPQIVKRHSSIEDEEGCLSLPGLYSKVRRARKIKVQAFNLLGELFECEAEDLLSRAIQHEADHLDGKLFIDYLGPLARHALKAQAPGIREPVPPGSGQRRISPGPRDRQAARQYHLPAFPSAGARRPSRPGLIGPTNDGRVLAPSGAIRESEHEAWPQPQQSGSSCLARATSPFPCSIISATRDIRSWPS